MAVVMIAGPQIVTAIVLATSERWLANSLASLLGVGLATSLGVAVASFGASEVQTVRPPSTSDGALIHHILNWGFVALLAWLAWLTYRNRHKREAPAWMARLQTAGVRSAFTIGFLLFLVMPTDLITTLAVGHRLAEAGSPYWHMLSFLAATLLLAGMPLLLVVLLGRRAKAALPRLREWMNANSWVVSEAVTVFFLVMSVRSALA
jgi:hypothetical protein